MSGHVDRNMQRVYHILEQAVAMKRRIGGMTADELFANEDKTDAVLYGLMVVGEAVRAMDDDFKDAHPDMPWKAIVGMRNFIVHEYKGIDYDMVWKAASEELPALHERLVEIYRSFEYPPDFTPPPPPMEGDA